MKEWLKAFFTHPCIVAWALVCGIPMALMLILMGISLALTGRL